MIWFDIEAENEYFVFGMHSTQIGSDEMIALFVCRRLALGYYCVDTKCCYDNISLFHYMA